MTVLYVAGAMRSGTTMAGQVLAASPDAVLVGEIRPALRLPDDHTDCDCGRTRTTCELWSLLAERDTAAVTLASDRAYSLRRLPSLLASVLLHRPPPDDVREVVEVLAAVAERVAPRTVIDTSKTPVGPLLWRLAGQQVDLVQCVRRPSEVAAAQARPSSETGLPREAPVKTWAVWVVYHLLTLAMRPFVRTRVTVRYRALRNDPRRVARAVWSRTGLTPEPTGDDPTVFVHGEAHVLAGNPRRSRHQVRILPLSDASRPPRR